MENIYDVIIAGGGIAGLTAAIYVARAGKTVLVLEAEYHGGQIVNAGSVENYPGIRKVAGHELAQNVYEQATGLGAKCVYERIVGVKKRENRKFEVWTEENNAYCANALIIASGTSARRLDVPGEYKFRGKGVSYCDICDGGFYKGRDVAVAGGGNSALGGALCLADICNKVYLIHRRKEFRAEAHLTDMVYQRGNIECIMNAEIKAIKGSDRVEKLVISQNNESGLGENELDISCLFISIGHAPDNHVFSEYVKLDSAGYVIAGEDCMTSHEGIYTAGDCRTKKVRQLVTAVADGAVAAIAACEYIGQKQH